MESSQVVGNSDQKCSDSESGWTMYIGSHIYNENYGEADDEDDENGNENKAISREGGGDESDDSMASDASSGPTLHLLIPDGIKEGNEIFGHLGNTDNVEQTKSFSANKKTCKQEKKKKKKKKIQRISIEKNVQQKVPNAESAESQV